MFCMDRASFIYDLSLSMAPLLLGMSLCILGLGMIVFGGRRGD